MSFINKLKQLPNFPNVSKAELSHLKQTASDTREAVFYEECMLIQTTYKLNAVYDILAMIDPKQLDNATLQATFDHWESQFTIALEYEPQPLLLLPLFRDNLSTAVLLSTMILSLLKKGVTAEAIMNSELLPHYFIAHLDSLDTDVAYTLLSNVSNPPPELPILLEKMQTTSIDILGIGRMTLSNQITEYNTRLATSYKPKQLTFSFTATEENANRLYQSFGRPFLLQVLTSTSSTDLQQFLHHTVGRMSFEEINILLDAIQTIPKEQRDAAFAQILQSLSNDQVLQMIEVSPRSAWELLLINPSCIHDLNQDKLDAIINKLPITLANATFAMKSTAIPKLAAYDEQIRRAVFDCVMKHASETIDEDIIKTLKESSQFYQWCQAVHEQLLSEFRADILANLPLTASSYIRIMDSCDAKKIQWGLLAQMTHFWMIETMLPYPENSDAVQSFIMNTLSQEGQLEISCLDIFHPQHDGETDGGEFRKNAKINTLKIALLEQNNVLLHEWIIETLQTHFAISNWQEWSTQDDPYFMRVITHDNTAFLKRYYQDVPLHERLTRINSKRLVNNSALHPQIIATILTLLPENERLTVVKEKYWREPILRCVNNLESLKTILLLLPEHDRLAACKQADSEGYTVLHTVPTDWLPMILSLLPPSVRIDAIKQRNNRDQTILPDLSSDPHALNMILSSLFTTPLNSLINDLSELEFILPYAEKFNINLAELTQVFLSNGSKQHAELSNYVSSHPATYLRCYFKLKAILATECNPAAQWLQDILTGKCNFDADSFQSHQTLLTQEPLNKLIQNANLQPLFQRLSFKSNEHSLKERLNQLMDRQHDDSAVDNKINTKKM